MQLGRHRGRTGRGRGKGRNNSFGTDTSYSAVNALSTEVYRPHPHPYNGILAALPTVFLDSRTRQGGVALGYSHTVTLTSSDTITNLQNEIDNSSTRAGHTLINLDDNFVALGTVRLKKKTEGAYFTVIKRTSASYLSEGVRVTVAELSGAPIIRTNNSNRGAIETAPGSDYYIFNEIKFETTAGQTQVIVNVSPVDVNGDNTGSTAADLPNHVYFARCLIDGRDTGNIVNGLMLNTRAGGIVDSIIRNIFFTGVESHGIGSYMSRGPFKIVGNYIEAGSINTLFGGADPFINDQCVPDQIEIRRNYFTMRDSWNEFGGSWDSIARAIKNRLEFKFGKHGLIEGNWFDKCPTGGGQNGEAWVVKSMAGENGLNASWYLTDDLTFRYNRARNIWNVKYVTGVQRPEVETLGGTHRISFYDNLVNDYGDTGYSPNPYAAVSFLGDVEDYQIVHETYVPKQASISSSHPRFFAVTADIADGDMPGFSQRDCIVQCGRYNFPNNKWMYTNQAGDGETELSRVTGGDYEFQKMMAMGGPSSGFPSGELTVVADLAAVNFTNDDPEDGLDNDSPAKGAGTGGSDLGCNYTRNNLATTGVQS